MFFTRHMSMVNAGVWDGTGLKGSSGRSHVPTSSVSSPAAALSEVSSVLLPHSCSHEGHFRRGVKWDCAASAPSPLSPEDTPADLPGA